MAKPVRGKYHFDLWSNNVVVECFTEGPARFAMNVSDRGKRYAFRGDAINVRHLVIGTLLTVVPDPDPEQPTWFNFSLLLPYVAGFDPPQTQERLTTIGIHSTEPNPNIGGILRAASSTTSASSTWPGPSPGSRTCPQRTARSGRQRGPWSRAAASIGSA